MDCLINLNIYLYTSLVTLYIPSLFNPIQGFGYSSTSTTANNLFRRVAFIPPDVLFHNTHI